MAVGELDAHAHVLVGLTLRQLAQDHSCGDVEMFSAVFKAWLGWAGELRCPACTRQLIDSAQAELAAAQRQCLH